jgi:hypothetical protein
MAKFERKPQGPMPPDHVEQLEPHFGADVPPMRDELHHVPGGIIAALHGSHGDLHAVHTRLAEIQPFLNGAIKMAEGPVLSFLQSLASKL